MKLPTIDDEASVLESLIQIQAIVFGAALGLIVVCFLALGALLVVVLTQ